MIVRFHTINLFYRENIISPVFELNLMFLHVCFVSEIIVIITNIEYLMSEESTECSIDYSKNILEII